MGSRTLVVLKGAGFFVESQYSGAPLGHRSSQSLSRQLFSHPPKFSADSAYCTARNSFRQRGLRGT
jgi:hypothetical protein